MHTERLSPDLVVVTFSDLAERERFMVSRRFYFAPGQGYNARWLAPEGSLPSHQLVMVPATAGQGDHPQALKMQITRQRRPETAKRMGERCGQKED